jgi:hypothetical protein
MAPRMSKFKRAAAQSSQSQEPFLPFGPAGGGQALEQLASYVADGSNEHGPTFVAHASEASNRETRDAWVFFCFLVAGVVPPMSLFLHAVLSTYGVMLVTPASMP